MQHRTLPSAQETQEHTLPWTATRSTTAIQHSGSFKRNSRNVRWLRRITTEFESPTQIVTDVAKNKVLLFLSIRDVAIASTPKLAKEAEKLKRRFQKIKIEGAAVPFLPLIEPYCFLTSVITQKQVLQYILEPQVMDCILARMLTCSTADAALYINYLGVSRQGRRRDERDLFDDGQCAAKHSSHDSHTERPHAALAIDESTTESRTSNQTMKVSGCKKLQALQ